MSLGCDEHGERSLDSRSCDGMEHRHRGTMVPVGACVLKAGRRIQECAAKLTHGTALKSEDSNGGGCSGTAQSRRLRLTPPGWVHGRQQAKQGGENPHTPRGRELMRKTHEWQGHRGHKTRFQHATRRVRSGEAEFAT